MSTTQNTFILQFIFFFILAVLKVVPHEMVMSRGGGGGHSYTPLSSVKARGRGNAFNSLYLSSLKRREVEEKMRVIDMSPIDGFIVKEGENVTLTCRSNLPWFFCLWKAPHKDKQCAIQQDLAVSDSNNGQAPNNVSEPVTVCREMSRLRMRGHQRECSLDISHVSAGEDYGSWMCLVTDGVNFNQAKSKVSLEVAQPASLVVDSMGKQFTVVSQHHQPEENVDVFGMSNDDDMIDDEGGDNILEIIEGDTIQISCSALHGHPVSQIRWYHVQSVDQPNFDIEPVLLNQTSAPQYRKSFDYTTDAIHTVFYEAKLQDDSKEIVCLSSQVDRDGFTVLYESSVTIKLHVSKLILPSTDHALRQKIGILSGVFLAIILLILILVCCIILICRKIRRERMVAKSFQRRNSTASMASLTPHEYKQHIWSVTNRSNFNSNTSTMTADRQIVRDSSLRSIPNKQHNGSPSSFNNSSSSTMGGIMKHSTPNLLYEEIMKPRVIVHGSSSSSTAVVNTGVRLHRPLPLNSSAVVDCPDYAKVKNFEKINSSGTSCYSTTSFSSTSSNASRSTNQSSNSSTDSNLDMIIPINKMNGRKPTTGKIGDRDRRKSSTNRPRDQLERKLSGKAHSEEDRSVGGELVLEEFNATLRDTENSASQSPKESNCFLHETHFDIDYDYPPRTMSRRTMDSSPIPMDDITFKVEHGGPPLLDQTQASYESALLAPSQIITHPYNFPPSSTIHSMLHGRLTSVSGSSIGRPPSSMAITIDNPHKVPLFDSTSSIGGGGRYNTNGMEGGGNESICSTQWNPNPSYLDSNNSRPQSSLTAGGFDSLTNSQGNVYERPNSPTITSNFSEHNPLLFPMYIRRLMTTPGSDTVGTKSVFDCELGCFVAVPGEDSQQQQLPHHSDKLEDSASKSGGNVNGEIHEEFNDDAIVDTNDRERCLSKRNT